MEKAADKTNFIQTTRGNLGQFGIFLDLKGDQAFQVFFALNFLIEVKSTQKFEY